MMNKFIKICRILSVILRNPHSLNRVLEEESFWHRRITRKYNIITGLPVIPLQNFFRGRTPELNPVAFLDGSSLPTDLALLKCLATGIPKCKYFEIGTWRGESVANVADVAELCYTLNLPAAEMRRKGLPEDFIRLQGFFSKAKQNVIHLEGNSGTFDFASLDQKFDLIFIDGDHHYDMVRNDTENVFAHLAHPSSIIVWHDYAWNPEKIRYEVMAAILDGTPARLHSNIYHVSNTLCAAFFPESFPGAEFKSPVIPDHWFKVSLEPKP